MMEKKRSIVEWAMHYRQIVILITAVLIAFGVYGLGHMNKNEFPNFTIRQGVVMAVYPGATSEEIEEQVTKPLENYILSFKEVKKAKTKSYSRNGVTIIQVELNDDVSDKDRFWSKFKHGVQAFKQQLPSGVVAIQVNDDFGDTSALLITMESKEKTYRELNDYMNALKDSLRKIESVGRLTVQGLQKEQISVYLDNGKLSQYGISDRAIAGLLMQKGFVSTAGTLKNERLEQPIIVERALNMTHDVEMMIVYSDDQGNNIRLKDVARVVREYPEPSSVITNNGRKCLLLSVEIKSGRSITDMGEEIDKKMEAFKQTLPEDVSITTITNQSKVVGDSVVNFLKELLIAIFAVVIVVMLLMPMRVALVAASTIPVSIFISLGLFYAFGIELNTVSLAALIVTLGMIVDNSIVIIDSYVEMISNGKKRWQASIDSTNHFFRSILSATLAISVTFFPFLMVMTGMMHDFLLTFPWAITIVLVVSLIVAMLLVPFLQFWFIRKPLNMSTSESTKDSLPAKSKKSFSFLDFMQTKYNTLVEWCFRNPHITIVCGVMSVVLGVLLMKVLPQRQMPYADRDQFAVEIQLPTGSSLKRTTLIADSLENILKKDKRIISVAAFKGASSPRFHTSYAPQFAGPNYAQFVVNTPDAKTTVHLIDEYHDKYADYFPDAQVKFKRLSYGEFANTIEIRLSGDDWQMLKKSADSLTDILREMPQLTLVHNDVNGQLQSEKIEVDADAADRLGVSNKTLREILALRYYSDGIPVGDIWNGDYDISIRLKGKYADAGNLDRLLDEQIPAGGGQKSVPLRQIAKAVPVWQSGEIPHRNGIRTITVISDVKNGVNGMRATAQVQKKLKNFKPSEGISMVYGGEYETTNENNPKLIASVLIAAAIIFFILLAHFREISTSVLILVSLTLCLFGATMGVLISGVDFSMTCFLGVISLMGILVRNAIIMFDYAEELQKKEKLSAHEAIIMSAKRRMRPIFLTSAAASMGVIPMMLGGSGLWAPMGNVIFYGTLITMVLILTVLPVAYSLVAGKKSSATDHDAQLESQ